MPLPFAPGRFPRLMPISLLLAPGACSTGPFTPEPDPRLAELTTGMDQCLQIQAKTAEQLAKQQEQLQQQRAALEAVARAVTPPEEAPHREVVTATVIAGEACAAPSAEEQEIEPEQTAKSLVGELEEVWLV